MSNYSFEFQIFVFVALVLALMGLVSSRDTFKFPVVIGMLALVWVVPQGLGLEYALGGIHENRGFWTYASFCLVFLWAGFSIAWKKGAGRGSRSPQRAGNSFSKTRLLLASAGLCVVGQASSFLISNSGGATAGSQWTGVVTMYALFTSCSGMALCLSMLIYAKTRSSIALLIALVSAMPLLAAALSGVRREQLFDLVIFVAGSWFFVRRFAPPRAAVFAALIAGGLVLNTAGPLRAYVESGEGTLAEAFFEREFYRQVFEFTEDEIQSSEIRLAQYDFDYTNETGELEYGAEYWNILVHQYIPAFLVGREFKEALKFQTLRERIRTGEELGASSLGSTRTGFSDSYRGFGVFGVLVFFVLGWFFGTFYGHASGGGIASQYYYLVFLAEGLKALTHSTSSFLSALPFVFIVSAAVFAFSRSRRGSLVRRPASERYLHTATH